MEQSIGNTGLTAGAVCADVGAYDAPLAPFFISPESALGHVLDRATAARLTRWQRIKCMLKAGWQAGVQESLKGIAHFALNNTGQSALVNLYFNNTAAANIGNTAGLQPSGVAGSWFISLHTANPGVTGNQQTSEAAYGSYARVGIARSGAGWTVTGNQPCIAENAAACTFPTAASGTETETYFGIGTLTSGAGSLLISAVLSSSLAVTTGITPSFAINSLQFQAT